MLRANFMELKSKHGAYLYPCSMRTNKKKEATRKGHMMIHTVNIPIKIMQFFNIGINRAAEHACFSFEESQDMLVVKL